MARNYFSLKTGHKPSDEYFKHAPMYCDSDLFKHSAFWFVIGVVVGLICGYS